MPIFKVMLDIGQQAQAPLGFKDIDEVMAAQKTLVRPLARFMPKLVKMAPAGERPED